jgi:hypothetical protein
LVISYALLGLGVVFHLTWMAFWLQPTAGRIVALLLVGLAVASLLHLRLRRQWRHWAPRQPWSDSWRSCTTASPSSGACRAHLLLDRHPLRLRPATCRRRLRVHAVGQRHPRSLRRSSLAVGLAVPNTHWTFAASSLSQFLVLLAVVALVRALGLSNRATFLTAVFVSVIPLGMFNLIYTWPKMLSAACGLAAAAVLVVAMRQRSRPAVPLATAATLAALATLAHGGSAVALPLFGGLALVLLATQPAGQRSLLRGWVGPTPPPPQAMAPAGLGAIAIGALGVIACVVLAWRRAPAVEAAPQP